MDKTKKCCVHCHQSFAVKRNPKQQYCAQQACQNTRKRFWRKQKRASGDPDYRENQQRANQGWQQRCPDYWHRYREAHPDYVQRNRDQARRRKQKQQQLRSNPSSQGDASQFAKSDALIVTIAVVARV